MLSVHEVTTAYQGLVAISAVSIEVGKGEIVCVAGANGAGNTDDLALGDLDRNRRDGDQSLIGGGDFMHRQHDDPQDRR